MNAIESIRLQLAYSDEMNRRIIAATSALAAEKLDEPFDMGLGTLRKTLAHLYVGEQVWLERWKGKRDTPWPPYETTHTPGEILSACETLWSDRDRFLAQIDDARLAAPLVYRDSKGSLFQATLHEMMIQGINHSIHHRAQAVNMIRRLGGPLVEVDFMYWRRQPVQVPAG